MDKPTVALCAAFILAVTFYGGVVFQRHLQLAETKNVVDFYNQLVQFKDRLNAMMDEVESIRKTSCGKVEA